MTLEMEVRPSDAPLVDCVWRGRSSGDGRLTSISSSHWHLVVSEAAGGVAVSVHGPESGPVVVPLSGEASWVGIRFRLGVMLQDVAIADLVDGELTLPRASHRSFWWKGGGWEAPTYANAEGLVARLAREDLIGREPLVDEVMRDQGGGRRGGRRGGHAVSLRTLQRRFHRATGLARRTVRQIEQARRAGVRLREGATPAEVTHELGYYDQPHLTRSVRRYLGRTPAELAAPGPGEHLSLLYKTDPAGAPTVTVDRLGDPGEQRADDREQR